MIRCRGVGFTYPNGTRALDGVDLEIRAGERVAIVGQNGSGKSKLVRHFNGLLRPTDGTVEVDGRPGRRNLLWWLTDTPRQRVARWAMLAGFLLLIVGRVSGVLPSLP